MCVCVHVEYDKLVAICAELRVLSHCKVTCSSSRQLFLAGICFQKEINPLWFTAVMCTYVRIVHTYDDMYIMCIVHTYVQ